MGRFGFHGEVFASLWGGGGFTLCFLNRERREKYERGELPLRVLNCWIVELCCICEDEAR